MDDYWKALISGLTPENKKEAALMLKAPFVIVFALVFLGIVFRGLAL